MPDLENLLREELQARGPEGPARTAQVRSRSLPDGPSWRPRLLLFAAAGRGDRRPSTAGRALWRA